MPFSSAVSKHGVVSYSFVVIYYLFIIFLKMISCAWTLSFFNMMSFFRCSGRFAFKSMSFSLDVFNFGKLLGR